MLSAEPLRVPVNVGVQAAKVRRAPVDERGSHREIFTLNEGERPNRHTRQLKQIDRYPIARSPVVSAKPARRWSPSRSRRQ